MATATISAPSRCFDATSGTRPQTLGRVIHSEWVKLRTLRSALEPLSQHRFLPVRPI